MFWRVLSFPRYKLISLPTPMEKAPNLSKRLGVEVWVKRDDVMELALGGNKARKLEFILGHVLSEGYDCVVTTGAYHSNHVRLTIAAARKAGLDAYAVLYRHMQGVEPELQGNILLDKILGGSVEYADSPEEAEEMARNTAERLRASGRRPYIIPAGGASAHGVLGYASASFEILKQSLDMGFRPDYIVHASGTSATQAGLVLGLKLLGAEDVRVVGISNGREADQIAERGVRLVEKAIELLGVDLKVSREDFMVYDRYSFGGYGSITREVVDTIKMVGSLEGLILDPVYTAKAMYGLMDLAERGEIKGKVIFIHTGGVPIVFQYPQQISKYI